MPLRVWVGGEWEDLGLEVVAGIEGGRGARGRTRRILGVPQLWV